MPEMQTHFIKTGSRWQCLAGIKMRRILSADLFMELGIPQNMNTNKSLADRCRDRWTDLSGMLAAMPEPAELHLVLTCNPTTDGALPVFECGVLAVGRGRTKAMARTLCLQTASDLGKIFSAVLDYAEYEPVTEPNGLDGMTAHLNSEHVTEVRRRQELIHIGKGRLTSEPVLGFAASPFKRKGMRNSATSLEVRHLFPWAPGDDPWWRLVDIMAKERGRAALVVHALGWQSAPQGCRDAALHDLDGVEHATELIGDDGHHLDVLRLKAGALSREALERLSALEGPVIAARVFLASEKEPSSALISVVKSSLDDPSVERHQPGGQLLFRGGASLYDSDTSDMMAPLDNPSPDLLFSPQEAPAVLRTPMPTDSEFPGFPLTRARTAPMLGDGGGDCLLGTNIHRGLRRNVALDIESRFRHCHIIGQTGTGKSTLLLHMILHDIRQGRGVGVIDPHGSLIEDILLRFPPNRVRDLVIVDMTDVENPVGFNPLVLTEDDPVSYRSQRDLLIDELFAYIDRTYDLKQAGGPIFETHFRAMLGLLMGLEKPAAPLIPNLLIFRLLYTNSNLRRYLTEAISGRDYMLEEFIKEALSVQRDASLKELAPYITSKFSRFVSDVNLRNITCQNRTLDIDSIVAKGGILLVHLGKGHIGEYAAGLLASQVVSRVQRAVMKRGTAGTKTPFHLYADEFQLVASQRFAELLAEGRKFGLAVTMAHQYASQVPEGVLRAVIGNVGTNILFRVGAQDSEFFAPLFSPTFGRRDLVSLSNYRAYVRGAGSLGEGAFNIDVPPPGGATDTKLAERLRRLSRNRHGRKRETVEQEIAKTVKAYQKMT